MSHGTVETAVKFLGTELVNCTVWEFGTVPPGDCMNESEAGAAINASVAIVKATGTVMGVAPPLMVIVS